MKILTYCSIIFAFLLLTVGISISILSTDGRFIEDSWGAIAGIAFCTLLIPWVLVGFAKLICFAIYEGRKAWLKAAEDLKDK